MTREPQIPGNSQTRIFEIEERISPEIIASLMFQYPNAYDAVLELVDNSYDNRSPGGHPIVVYINTAPDSLTISDSGGLGMGEAELRNFFFWGVSEKRQRLGRYGFGGKAALGSLAKSIRLSTARAGEPRGFQILDNTFDERGKEPKAFVAEEIPAKPGHGFVQIEMQKLKRKVEEGHLVDILSNKYRLALVTKRLAILVNGKKIEPLSIPILPQETQEFSFEALSNNPSEKVIVTGWVGRLDLEKPMSKLIKPGIRGYVYGRLISDGIFFGFPDPGAEPTVRPLIGEINIDSDQLPLLPAKTGFVNDSVEFEYITEQMEGILGPHIAKLIGEQEKKRIPKGDKVAFELAERIIRYGFVQLGELTYGVKSTSPSGRAGTEKSHGHHQEQHRGETEHHPATKAPDGAVGERKRLPMTLTIVSRDLGHERSALASEAGIKKLCINPNFSGYRAARDQGDKQLVLYLIETAAFEIAKSKKEEGLDVTSDELWKEGNRLFREFVNTARKTKLL